MVAIAVRFLSARYHATPWGRHVNEGVPEWPPSPWRLLRAIVASWQRRGSDHTPESVNKVLATLSTPPQFWLPSVAAGHTRHYMPWFKKGPGDTTLVFDTFVAFGEDQEVVFIWPDTELEDGLRDVLAGLLDGVTYLGRAESWCTARLESAPPHPNCGLAAAGASSRANATYVRVLCPAPEDPDVLLEALLVETGDLRSRERRLDPPGSQWALYALPSDPFMVKPQRSVKRVPRSVPTMVRYALDSAVLPSLTDTVAVGEQARRAVMGLFGRLSDGSASQTLTGKSAEGAPLAGHQHAFYLPEDADRDGRLDHLTVYAPLGFAHDELEALSALRHIGRSGNSPELRTLLLGAGEVHDFVGSSSLVGPSASWRSITPFVLNRHPKVSRSGTPKFDSEGNQLDGPENQVRLEWHRRMEIDPTLPGLIEAQPVGSARLVGREIRWSAFQRWRSAGRPPATAYGTGFVIRLAQPVTGPIALGYACHYGLGVFAPQAAGPEKCGPAP